MSKEFLRLILVSFFLAIPVGWILMSQWPDDCDYAFRINIGWWVFGIAGAIALMIAIVIIVIQAMKAATTNPVTSLRSQ